MRHVSEYRGWVIAVTPREEAPALWRAVIEVWPPGTTWRTDRPRVVSFARSAVSQDEILIAFWFLVATVLALMVCRSDDPPSERGATRVQGTALNDYDSEEMLAALRTLRSWRENHGTAFVSDRSAAIEQGNDAAIQVDRARLISRNERCAVLKFARLGV
jgi:hypothetical protein